MTADLRMSDHVVHSRFLGLRMPGTLLWADVS
jgi:hypothetical protein